MQTVSSPYTTAGQYTVALAGNPNAGKSTIFNALTGEHQHVGNWPGKTIAVKDGMFSIGTVPFSIIDLPGTYSLTAYSMEEIITRDYLIHEQPDAVIAVVDASNLERNLYLAVQVIELGMPVIVALNMTDIATARGLTIDVDRLSAGLDAPVITTVATRGRGLDDLKTCILDTVTHQTGTSHSRKPHTYRESYAYGVTHCPKCR